MSNPAVMDAPSAPIARTRPSITFRETAFNIRQDIHRKRRQMGRPVTWQTTLTGFLSINILAVVLWRISIYLRAKGLRAPAVAIYYLNVVLFSFDATPISVVGPGLVVAHLNGCVLHGKFGRNLTLYGRNALGGLGKGDIGGWCGGPIVGDNVTVGIGGAVLTHEAVGDNATISAGAWCFKEVPANAIVFGMPARLVRYKSPEEIAEEMAERGV